MRIALVDDFQADLDLLQSHLYRWADEKQVILDPLPTILPWTAMKLTPPIIWSNHTATGNSARPWSAAGAGTDHSCAGQKHAKTTMENNNWEALSDYIKSYVRTLPQDITHAYCKNYAVNAVLCHYAELAAQAKSDMEISIRMKACTIIPEPEFCVLMGNLLENAIEACTPLECPCTIRVNIQQLSDSMLSLTVDNTCPREPLWRQGRLLSGKRKGYGTGIASVRSTAERYHGDARFQWTDGVFYASVLLNP